MSQGFNRPVDPEFGPQSPRKLDQFGLPAQETKTGRGCCFYGCIASIIIFVLLIVGTYFAVQRVRNIVRQYVATYTDTEPVKLPVVEMPDAQREAVIQRADEFKKALTEAPEDERRKLTDEDRTLVLTADELNALLEQSPEVKGKFSVSIEGDQIKARVSLPLNEFPGLQGRYLNAESKVEVSIEDGTPVLRLKDIRVKGRPLPKEFQAIFEQTNWLEDAKMADGRRILPLLEQRLESIRVKDGKLIVVARKDVEARPGGAASEGRVVEWKAADGGNGHFYQLVRTPRSAREANAEAGGLSHQGAKGHLATITSAEENAFLRDRVVLETSAWIGLTDDPAPLAGDAKAAAPPARQRWRWVTGEPVDFLSWPEGEPGPRGDDQPARFGIFIGEFGSKRGQWNARPDDVKEGLPAVVEFEPTKPAAPEPEPQPAK